MVKISDVQTEVDDSGVEDPSGIFPQDGVVNVMEWYSLWFCKSKPDLENLNGCKRVLMLTSSLWDSHETALL